MAEIKHDFTAGKMNKDLDERLVRNGEYRDAMNIQVRTTDGGGDGVGDAGVVQNLQGNSIIGTSMSNDLFAGYLDADFVCVGSIADEKSDNAYFLFTNAHSTCPIKLDTIVQQNIITGQTTPVVVDVWQVTTATGSIGWGSVNGSTGTPFTELPITTVSATTTTPEISINNLRVNMTFGVSGVNCKGLKIKEIGTDQIILYDSHTCNFTTANSPVIFTHERVLKFDKDVRITGINIIDDLLLFTDGINEPKKINITRSINGTDVDGNIHTSLLVTDPTGGGDTDLPDNLEWAGNLEFEGLSSDLLEEHVTILRPAPTTPPTLEINTRDLGELTFVQPNQDFSIGGNWDDCIAGAEIYLGVQWPDNIGTSSPILSLTNFIVGDILTVTQENEIQGEEKITFKVEFVEYVTTDGTNTTSLTPTDKIKVKFLSTVTNILDLSTNEWLISIELSKPKFELKFPRFGYRYKYEDGEYSAFSPWSELAFDPGIFNYDSTHGYNLGMVNTIQNLVIKDFVPYYTDRALDIVGVDILYKSTDSANVYTIKSIRKEVDPEWELFSPGVFASDGVNSIETGRLEITSEAIHRVLPSNQILRTFDNVPRYAKAQEITGSRVVYANYTQGYDIEFPVGLSQLMNSEEVFNQPKRSVKTIRDYRIGMVFGDKYGRETPVIASSNTWELSDGAYAASTGDLSVEKSLCAFANRFSVKQEWENPLSSSNPGTMPWMEYVKYYVKETSNEYYNLVLDRWYYARNNENIWLSFPSADRNKVDLETYLLLKKSHGEDAAVLEKARYKVIAIENEAPDFIKIDHRPMGTVALVNQPSAFSSIFIDNSQNANVDVPILLIDPDVKSITIRADAWYGFLDLYGQNMRGKLKCRIVGRTMTLGTSPVITAELNSGNWRTVTHHNKLSGSGTDDDYVINLEESFGASANMLEAFNNAGIPVNNPYSSTSTTDLQYFLEFKEEVTENKPEFDGRFFVLIEKDIAIEKHVETFSSKKTEFVVSESYKLGYIDSQEFNPAENGPYAIGGAGDVFTNQVTDWDGNYTETDPYEAWRWWGFGTFNTPTEAHFFALGCDSSYAGGANQNSDNEPWLNYAGQTRSFWYKWRAFHSSDTPGGENFEATTSLGLAVESMVFIDGARANTLKMQEQGTNAGSLYWQINDNYVTGAGDDSPTGYGGGGYDVGGVSVYNYKPTALDQGHAAEGLGRLQISSVGNDWNAGSGGPTTSGAAQFYFDLAQEGTYFQFEGDDSGIDGKPHVYQTIHRSVNDSSLFFAPHFNVGQNDGINDGNGAANFGNTQFSDLSINNTQNQNRSMDTGMTYCESLDGPNSNGTFGGENLIWNKLLANGGIIGSGWESPNLVGVSGDLAEIHVGTTGDNNGCPDPGNTPEGRKSRTCQKCNFGMSSVLNNEEPLCGRSSMRFEFRRVDKNGQLTNTGMMVDEWDPRGQLKHDGTIGHLTLQIMTKINEDGSVIIPESERSVWETEPKEDVGLDIYYEATHSIPMQLSKGNTLAFSPLKSKVGAIRSTAEGDVTVDLQDYTFNGASFIDTMVGGVEYTTSESLIKVVNTDSNELPVNNTYGLGIGDFMTFTHSSGLRTRSRIENYYELAANGVTYVPVTSYPVTIYYDPNNTVDPNAVQVTSGLANFSSGSNIVFDDVGTTVYPTGVFGINYGGDNYGDQRLSDTSFFDQTNPSELTGVATMATGFYQINKDVYQYEVDLGWHNCYSFGNGVESDRIRDDFNAPTIDNGIKVSTTFVDYGQEDKTSGLTYSGLYNATSSVNDLNEFNMGEKISKNINPAFGSIQALKTRETDLVTLCEDKILKILANKEAVFMADNDPNIVSTDRVLGQVTTFKGDYGISKNPESLATDQYRMYFTDTQRGAVLRLSMDGLTPISDVGMRSWFRENLRGGGDLLGTFDIINGEYNLTIKQNTTLSFNEKSKGWVSFKSFIPQEGVSVSGTYLTVKNSGIFRHYVDTFDDAGVVNNRNIFYNQFVDGVNDAPANSSLTVMFNDQPSSVKSFRTINYEGSQARINQYLDANGNPSGDDGEYYNIFPDKLGWWVTDFHTDLQNGKVYWFIDKENKWFNNICGTATTLENLDTAEFTVQGIGTQVADPVLPEPEPTTFTLTIQND
mgnify:CR=1 FL=1